MTMDGDAPLAIGLSELPSSNPPRRQAPGWKVPRRRSAMDPLPNTPRGRGDHRARDCRALLQQNCAPSCAMQRLIGAILARTWEAVMQTAVLVTNIVLVLVTGAYVLPHLYHFQVVRELGRKFGSGGYGSSGSCAGGGTSGRRGRSVRASLVCRSPRRRESWRGHHRHRSSPGGGWRLPSNLVAGPPDYHFGLHWHNGVRAWSNAPGRNAGGERPDPGRGSNKTESQRSRTFKDAPWDFIAGATASRRGVLLPGPELQSPQRTGL